MPIRQHSLAPTLSMGALALAGAAGPAAAHAAAVTAPPSSAATPAAQPEPAAQLAAFERPADPSAFTQRIADLRGLVRNAETGLGGLTVPQGLQRQKTDVVQFLHGWGADLARVQNEASNGRVPVAIGDLAGSSYRDVQGTLQRVRQDGGVSTAQLQPLLLQLAPQIQRRVDALRGTPTGRELTQGLARLQTTVSRAERRVRSTQVPQGLATQKQDLVRFLHNWSSDLAHAHAQASNQALSQTLAGAAIASYGDVRRLVRDFQHAGAPNNSTLGAVAADLAPRLADRFNALQGTRSAKAFTAGVADLQASVSRAEQQVRSLPLPQAAQAPRQQLVRLLHTWDADLARVHNEASHGQVAQAIVDLASSSYGDVQATLKSLRAAG